MSNSNRPIWFGPKRVGYGLRPCHPIGWILTAVLAAAFAVGLHLILSSGMITTGIITISLFLVVYGVIVGLTYCKNS